MSPFFYMMMFLQLTTSSSPPSSSVTFLCLIADVKTAFHSFIFVKHTPAFIPYVLKFLPIPEMSAALREILLERNYM